MTFLFTVPPPYILFIFFFFGGLLAYLMLKTDTMEGLTETSADLP